jgi:ferrous iron transport protein B
VKEIKKIFLVGTPNVGKSVLFNRLTGAYVTVSNYPGTTVDITCGTAHIMGADFEIVDTPGLYSLMPITEEERVTRHLLMKDAPYLVLHVADGKNLRRMLSLTLQLKEAELPLILVINMMDEAQALGIGVNRLKLEKLLGIPVVLTAAAQNKGIGELRGRIHAYR